MIGIIVQLAVSWLMVWLFEKGNLSFLGLRPSKKKLRNFLVFFLVTAACSVSGYLLKMLIAKQSWVLNQNLDIKLIANGIWFVVKSVLFEELIFRGVIFYMLIKKIGATKAIIISSIAFGVYHWFSHELFGNPVQMAIEFFMSGIMGLVLAYGYAKTFSLYIPIAIHLGWNIVQMVLFSGDVIGGQIFTEVFPRRVITISYFSFFTMQLLPVITCWVINTLLLRKIEQAKVPAVASGN